MRRQAVTEDEIDALIDLWTGCSTVREFELKASALYDVDLSTRLAFRAYSFIRRHPAAVENALVQIAMFGIAIVAALLFVSGAAFAFALAAFTILSGGVYGFAKVCDGLFTRIMEAEEAAGSETPA